MTVSSGVSSGHCARLLDQPAPPSLFLSLSLSIMLIRRIVITNDHMLAGY